jgi:RND family efflux transporter MFP subunit
MEMLFLFYQKGNSLEVLSAEERPVSPVCTVLVASVNAAPEHREIRFFGVTRSMQQAVISPLVRGKLQSRSVSVGDFVRAGEEIAWMDSREYAHLAAIKKAFLDESREKLRQGERNLERMKGLYRDQVISPQEMEQEETSFQVLQAHGEALESELAEAMRKLAETRIGASFDIVLLDVVELRRKEGRSVEEALEGAV